MESITVDSHKKIDYTRLMMDFSKENLSHFGSVKNTVILGGFILFLEFALAFIMRLLIMYMI